MTTNTFISAKACTGVDKNFNDMDDYSLNLIFSKLTFMEKMNAISVCNKWHNLITNLIQSQTSLGTIVFSICKNKKHQVSSYELIGNMFEVKGYWISLTREKLSIILSKCPKLKSLILQNVEFYREILEAFSNHCSTKLEHLDLSYSCGFGINELVQIISDKSGQTLKHVMLKESGITEKGLNALITGCVQLEALEIDNNIGVTGLFFFYFGQKIKYLSIVDCIKITGTGIQALIYGNGKNLKHLRIGNSITPLLLRLICENLTKLKSLELAISKRERHDMHINWSKSFRDLISRYMWNDLSSYSRHCMNELNQLRDNCISKKLNVKHESSLEMLQKYYDQISSFESKVSHIEVSFKWKDAYDRDRSFFVSDFTIPRIAFEKICILFNIGTVESQLGVSNVNDGIHNESALKLAVKHFQSAAGVFQALKHTANYAVGSYELSSDMQNEILNVLQNLMLAQAQETIFYKATNDNMKEVLIAKIANQCEDYYADVLKQMQIVKFNWPEKDWLTIISMKQAAFLGIAEYYQSIVSNQKKEFGEQIARLQKSVEFLKDAETRGALNFSQSFKDHLNKATNALEEAKKDNDFIYHAKVTEYKTLAAIGKMLLVKVTPVPERFFHDYTDLFEKLLPVGVHHINQKLDIQQLENEISKSISRITLLM